MARKDKKDWGLEELLSVIGFVFELLRVVVNALRKRGGTIDDLRRFLREPDLVDKVFDMVVQKPVSVIRHLINTDAKPFLPAGWQGVEEHRGMGQFTWDSTKVSLYLSPRQQGGQVIIGHDLRQELVGKPVLNANVLDYLLAHPELIPEEWKGKYIYFWGTIYRYSGVNLCVRYLYWLDGRWDWDVDWLFHDWGGGRPAAVASVV